MVREHYKHLELFFLGQLAISPRVFINQNSTEAPVAWMWNTEWNFQYVWKIGDEVLLDSGITIILVKAWEEKFVEGIVALCEVTLAAPWVTLIGEHLYDTSENTIGEETNLGCTNVLTDARINTACSSSKAIKELSHRARSFCFFLLFT